MLAMAKLPTALSVTNRDDAMALADWISPKMPSRSTTAKPSSSDQGWPSWSSPVAAFRLVILFVCLLTCTNTFALTSFCTATPDDPNADQIVELIAKLDAKKFAQREQASQELIDIGEQAIRPLAMKSFECSPEASWRIRKILEQICTRGDETVFYKTTGILRLRFDSGSAEMGKRLSALEAKWKAQRKEKFISFFRKQGAIVIDPLEGQEQLQRGNIELLARGQAVLINGHIVELSPKPKQTVYAKPKSATRKRLSSSEAKREIERILSSDLQQARRIVLGKDEADPQPDPAADPDLIELQRQMLARGHFLGNGAIMPGQGITIELGDRWKGSAKDLQSLSEFSNLAEVKLSLQKLDSLSLEQIAAVRSIKKLTIENCDISPEALRNAEWSKSLKEVELAGLQLSHKFLASLESFEAANSLTFRECELEPSVKINVLSRLKNLRSLQFHGVDISPRLFDSFAEMRQISKINLLVCQFKTADYKKLESLRPKLQISYTAQAFLGVRGPIGLTGTGAGKEDCIVSEVIPGSGAQKGGVKVHDVIETINGEKLEFFNDLRLHIAQHRPGQKITLTVQRQGKSLELEIELSSLDQAQP